MPGFDGGCIIQVVLYSVLDCIIPIIPLGGKQSCIMGIDSLKWPINYPKPLLIPSSSLDIWRKQVHDTYVAAEPSSNVPATPWTEDKAKDANI